MQELQTKLLNVYDLLVSMWLTIGETRQLALLLVLSGGLGFILSLLRLQRRKIESDVDFASSAEKSEESTSNESELLADADIPSQKDSGASVFGGLRKTRQALSSKLQKIFSSNAHLDELYAQLEELLITSDMGVATTKKLLDNVRQEVQQPNPETIRQNLYSQVVEILSNDEEPEIVPRKVGNDPLVIAVIGVNGVGKTTTIGKLSWQFAAQGKRVLIAAGDTFRAAAQQQLEVWAERSGATVVSGADNAKPSTVAYEAVHQAKREGYDVLIIDTAGRLHTRVNLMNELQNVMQLIGRELPGSPHETILVVDATTGQNALQQAIDFNQRAPLSGIIVTKLDGTPKGGIVVAIKHELGIPIRYIGVGEQATDLKLFSAEEFADALFAMDATPPDESESIELPQSGDKESTGQRVVRKRRHA